MITIKHKNDSYKIKNKLSEMTIDEYENVSSIISDDNKEYFEKYMDVMVYLGVPSPVVESMDLEELIQFIKVLENCKVKGFKKTIELDGCTFRAIEDGKQYPTITPKVLKLIEKVIKDKPTKNIADLLAILFKREDEESEHYSPSHLKYKVELFRNNLKANVAIPYIVYISEKILNNIKIIATNA